MTPNSHSDVLGVFRKFEYEMGLDPYTLLFEARKKQDTEEIDKALQAFHGRCIELGLTEPTANQYGVVMRSFFRANRLDVRKRPKKLYWRSS